MLMGGGREGGTPQTPKPRFPQGLAWLVVIVARDAAASGSQLQHLLTHPEFTEFLAAVPQAGRILRPLCRMLGLVPLSPPLALPARPARPRPPRPPRIPPPPFNIPLKRPRLPPVIFTYPPPRLSPTRVPDRTPNRFSPV